ncbi:hypothetical protein CFOL_v3_33623, partial [Cephalotus follicularis]
QNSQQCISLTLSIHSLSLSLSHYIYTLYVSVDLISLEKRMQRSVSSEGDSNRNPKKLETLSLLKRSKTISNPSSSDATASHPIKPNDVVVTTHQNNDFNSSCLSDPDSMYPSLLGPHVKTTTQAPSSPVSQPAARFTRGFNPSLTHLLLIFTCMFSVTYAFHLQNVVAKLKVCSVR